MFKKDTFSFKGLQGEDVDVFSVPLPEVVTTASDPLVHFPQLSLPNMTFTHNDILIGSQNSQTDHIQQQSPVLENNVDPPESQMEVTPLRRTGRNINPPIWMKDYVSAKKSASPSLYSIDKVLSYDRLSSAYKTSIHAFSTHVKNFK